MQGQLIISVRLPNTKEWGQLDAGDDLRYDDGSREKTNRREATLARALARRDRWGQNYKLYADASFRVEDKTLGADGQYHRVVVAGVAYEPTVAVIPTVRQRLVNVGQVYNRAHKKANQENMADWLFDGADNWMGEVYLLDKWLTLSMAERVQICREVAAGYYTPAVA